MLDFHAHVLPGADHGSDSLDTSLAQLALAEEAGIDVLAATPHFYPQRHSLHRFLGIRQAAWKTLAQQYRGPIRLLLGAEVHLCVGLDRLEGLEWLCLPDTRVMLCELPYQGITAGLTETLERLLDLGFSPVLAHVDRYDPLLISNLFGLGLRGQLNAEALCRPLSRRRYLPWIDQGHIVALGSDIHGTQIGYRQYLRAVRFLGERFDLIDGRARGLAGLETA